mmetsp:Transcript_6733/g.19462  ORF Transcript_6733/g.19462 Transcript_6733/m.19462 type:complete len:498 (+) Transcript_6733:77-1570(+)
MRINAQWLNATLLLLASCIGSLSWPMVEGFEGPEAFRARHPRRIHYAFRQSSSSLLSAANDNRDGMRRMLEESWNASKMGRVPADPEAAANEAYSSILQAAGARAVAEGEELVEEGNMSGVFFVDLLLPAYDMSLKQDGVNLYDEVLAVEYCIALSNFFKGKTEIIVRDDSIVRTVAKILKAREERELEKARQEEEKREAEEEEKRSKAQEEEERRKTEEEGETGEKEIVISDGDFVFGAEPLDDETDEAEDDAEEENVPTFESESDEFRKKLLASWNDDVSDSTPEGSMDFPPTESSTTLTESQTETEAEAPIIAPRPKPYRIASLFGNARVIEGPDMASVIVGAVRANALPADDEDNIIILSPSGNDEMVAVRALVTKYGTEKKIILVNCQFQPVPRELMTAETVYSVLPLAGKKKTNSGDNNNNNNNTPSGDEQPPPKVVVLRRYPKGWEIFVDVGIGYELAETVPVNNQNKRGLPMDFIARSVTRHLDYVARR